MLGAEGYKTKKDLKAAIGKDLSYVETSIHGLEFKPNGVNCIVGPCAYTNRKWYATVHCKDGWIVKVE